MAAVFIRNRCFVQRISQTPYYLLTGRKPNLSKMNVFGTVCYGYVHGHKKKLDPRSKAGIFVGYEKNSSSFLVYYPSERKVQRHGLVTFTDYFQKNLEKSKNDDNNNNIIINDNNDNITNQNDVPENNNISNVPENINMPADVIKNDNDNDNFINSEIRDPAEEQTNIPIARQNPIRIHHQPEYLKDYVKTVDTGACYVDFCYKAAPKTYNEAISSDEADLWKKAMDEEMSSLEENKTYEVVDLPEGKHSVGGRWVYAVKQGPDDKDVFKARFVAKGFSQTYGVDYFSTFAPTARLSTIRMVIQIAVSSNYLIHQMDVKSAYLNAPIDCELYMDQPKGYELFSNDGSKYVFKLQKSLYGLKQSASNWREVLCQFFLDHGCLQSKTDPCIFLMNSKR